MSMFCLRISGYYHIYYVHAYNPQKNYTVSFSTTYWHFADLNKIK